MVRMGGHADDTVDQERNNWSMFLSQHTLEKLLTGENKQHLADTGKRDCLWKRCCQSISRGPCSLGPPPLWASGPQG